jgi:hypothetical protein
MLALFSSVSTGLDFRRSRSEDAMIYLDYVTQLPVDAQEMFLGKLDGTPVWSNGHVMFPGDPPFSGGAFLSDRSCQHAIDVSDPGNMPEVKPVAVCHDGDTVVVWFDDGQTVLDHRYFRMVLERWPAARFYSKPKGLMHHVRIEDQSKRVALVARINADLLDPPARLVALLQSANGKRRKLPTKAKKSANKKAKRKSH